MLKYLVLIPTGATIAARYGADWWHTIANLNPHLLRGVVIILAVAAVIVVSFLLWRRKRPAMPNDATIRREGLGELDRDLLRFPPRLLVLCLLLSGVSLAARVGILPVVALASPNSPTLGAATVASLALLYGQLVLPTPSGAGPIDVAVLGGASGVTLAAGKVLGVWRLYTTVLPIAVGLLAGSLAYGRAILSLIPRRGRDEA